MDRRKFSLSLIGSAAIGLTGCLGGGDDGDPMPTNSGVPGGHPPIQTPPPQSSGNYEPPSATDLSAATFFAQTIDRKETDARSGVAPGQANGWDLRGDFAIRSGGAGQFNGALMLAVITDDGQFDFPKDQAYAELTAYGPELTEADGVKSVSFTTDSPFVESGTTSAVLHPVPDARLQQTLDLTAAAGHGLTLTWSGEDRCGRGETSGELGKTPYFTGEPYYIQVVVRNPAGDLLATLYRRDPDGETGTWGSASLTAFAGQTVVLSFEQRSSLRSSTIDNVSVRDTTTNGELVTNGNFEAGATGWTVPAVRVAQNVTSGARTLGGLQVRRSFYTEPTARWGRMTDEFVNNGATAVTAKVRYWTNLGSDGFGVIYPTPDAQQKGLTTWSGVGGPRDVGFAFGNADELFYQSATALDTRNGRQDVTVQFDVSVPAGGRVTLVNFLVMTASITRDTATDISARAAEVDTQIADIANNFRTNLGYQRGMTQAQLGSLKNF